MHSKIRIRGWGTGLGCTGCRILVPQPGLKPGSPAVEAQSPDHWTIREFPQNYGFRTTLVHHPRTSAGVTDARSPTLPSPGPCPLSLPATGNQG